MHVSVCDILAVLSKLSVHRLERLRSGAHTLASHGVPLSLRRRPGLHEVQHLRGGARHAAVLAGTGRAHDHSKQQEKAQ